jgi:hypothetical protein
MGTVLRRRSHGSAADVLYTGTHRIRGDFVTQEPWTESYDRVHAIYTLLKRLLNRHRINVDFVRRGSPHFTFSGTSPGDVVCDRSVALTCVHNPASPQLLVPIVAGFSGSVQLARPERTCRSLKTCLARRFA